MLKMKMTAVAGMVGLLGGSLLPLRATTPAAAQSPAIRPPVELLKMRAAFAAAAQAGDAKAAASLSRFPLANIVFGANKTLSQAAFLKRFKDDFTRHKDIVDCLLNDSLEMDVSNGKSNFRKWRLNCNGNVYSFDLVDTSWRYTGYENINE